MSEFSPIEPEGDAGCGNPATGVQAWIISLDEGLCREVGSFLETVSCEAYPIHASPGENAESWLRSAPAPRLIVLDIGRDVEWGGQMIRQFRRRRIEAPVVVLTQDFSREFGSQIISLGVPYYFPRDFPPAEFLAVLRSLLRR